MAIITLNIIHKVLGNRGEVTSGWNILDATAELDMNDKKEQVLSCEKLSRQKICKSSKAFSYQ